MSSRKNAEASRPPTPRAAKRWRNPGGNARIALVPGGRTPNCAMDCLRRRLPMRKSVSIMGLGRSTPWCLRERVIQLTPAALERHLQGMTEKLRSGVNGRVREAIQQSVARILVGADGSLTIEARPYGLLGVETDDLPTRGCRQNGATPEYSARVNAGRAWRVRYESPALGIV